MRQVVCNAFGPPETLEIVNGPEPSPTNGQVVVQVQAAGANFVDALLVRGRYQIKPPLPFTPGMEVAGRITNPGDSDFSPGQRVLVTCWFGGFASDIAVPAAACVPVPAGVSPAQAATLVQSYATAHYALAQCTTVLPGEWVVVLGAGGGVGLAAVDTAKSLGARVLACASSPDKLAAATQAGADLTLAYQAPPGEAPVDLKARIRALTDGGADVVVDPVGGERTEQALRALRWGGRLLIIGFAAGDIPRLPTNQMLLNNRSVLGVDWGAWSTRNPDDNRALIGRVLASVAAGRLHPAEPTLYPLDRAADCLGDLEARRLVGKAALVP